VPRGVDAVRAFIEAFDSEDLDALAAVVDPEVEIQTSRGVAIGRDEARRWATRNPHGGLHQRLIIDALRDEGAHVIAFVRRQWHWREEEEIASEEKLAIVATIRDGLIARWQPFDDPDEALRAAGVEDAEPAE
jgi:ketosteroid isomerase-like protein